MTKFELTEDVSDELCSAMEAANPVDCYCTRAYRDAVNASGRRPLALFITSEKDVKYGCLAEYSQGRLSRGLHIQSTPTQADCLFWNGLLRVCRKLRITHLSLGTIGSAPEIPNLDFLLNARSREEYWVDLTVPELERLLRKQQRVVYTRAADTGMFMRQVSGADAVSRHRLLTSNSLGRRRERGENIPLFEQSEMPLALIESGAAQLFEAVLGESTVGSAIVTLSNKGAHGYSAGYSKEGMEAGASVFLYVSMYRYLKANGITVFNLGDAPRGSGLALFKKGLGGIVHPSTSKEFHMAGALHRMLLRIKSTFGRLTGS